MDVEQPKVYRQERKGPSALPGDYDYSSIRPYFPALHPNTVWVINRMRSGESTPLVNMLKTRDKMHMFFKYMYFQIIDKPAMYCPDYPLDRPMFNERAFLYMNIFAIALYFKCETIVNTLAPIRVGRLENADSYESTSEVSVVQYASHVYDHSFGDLLTYTIPVILMRREAYFAIPMLFRFGAWNPRNSFTVYYSRRNYHCQTKFSDWLEYAWSLLKERPYTKLSGLVQSLNNASHTNFYIGDKVPFQPVNCRSYNARYSTTDLDERVIIVSRSYARRFLCKLFLIKDPLRLMPQVIPFIRVFQRERFFVSQSSKAMNPEFRLLAQSSLEERFMSIVPICNTDNLNATEYMENNGHKMSLYDHDNVISLLHHFLVIVANRNVESLKKSIVLLLMDILYDTYLVYAFSKEPAVNIAYYMSHLLDGPFVQPNDLQHMLKNIPLLLIKSPSPDKFFPPFLRTSDSKYDHQIPEAQKLFKKELYPVWKEGKFNKAVRMLMKYRADIDEAVNTPTLDYCDWKNEYLRARMTFNLKTIFSEQQIKATTCAEQNMTAEDDGSLLCLAAGWKAHPREFFCDAKRFMVKRQATFERKRRKKKVNCLDLWTMEELQDKAV